METPELANRIADSIRAKAALKLARDRYRAEHPEELKWEQDHPFGSFPAVVMALPPIIPDAFTHNGRTFTIVGTNEDGCDDYDEPYVDVDITVDSPGGCSRVTVLFTPELEPTNVQVLQPDDDEGELIVYSAAMQSQELRDWIQLVAMDYWRRHEWPFEFDGRQFLIQWSGEQDTEEPPTFVDAWLDELGSDGHPLSTGAMITLHLDSDGQPTEMVLTDGTERTGEVAMGWNLDNTAKLEVINWTGYDGKNSELLTVMAMHSDFRQIVLRWMINAAGYVATHIGKAA